MKRKAEIEVETRNKILKLEEEEEESYQQDDVTVLPPGSEIKRGSLTQVPKESPTTILEDQWKVVNQLGGKLQLARDIAVPASEEDRSETENTTDSFSPGENVTIEPPSTLVQDVGVDGDSEQPGPDGLSDLEESIRQNRALWAVYFRT